MKVQRILAAGALCLASFALVSCAGSKEQSVVGNWGTPDDATGPALVFEDDGSMHGTDGCNNLMGSYTEEGGKIVFGGLASTMMFCEGVDDWLSKGESATIDGEILTVFNEADKEIGKLARIVN
ncbi:META domain-containing protein [Leucobacter chinensis]|uniref:META domain-containing protein n=1 Tax=Leucobacter chinensis TaxID=2851010 RepID=UPI001C22ECF8|nr:META domain-containing protein [Leucobacter chinensis]